MRQLFYLTLLSILTFTKITLAGGMTSSGGDYLTTEGNPWFIGTAVVTYCIENGDFSRSELSSEQLIDEAILDWTKNLKNLNTKTTLFKLPDGKFKNLSLEFQKEICSPTTELRFLLGTHSAAVQSELQHMATYTVAFASKGKTDDFTGRSKGFIWLAPDQGKNKYLGPATPNFWQSDIAFYNVLLHELGHVFGIEHQFSGFMSASYPSSSVFGLIQKKETAASIALQAWLSMGHKTCGQVWGIEDSKFAKFFDLKSPNNFQVCLERVDRVSPDYNLKLAINKNEVVSSFDGKSDINISGKSTIAGKYFESKIGTPLDYKWHVFLDFYQPKLVGTLSINGKKYPTIIEQKLGCYLDYTIVDGSDFVTFKSNLGL